MNRRTEQKSRSRRDFFRDGLRYGVLAMLAAAGAKAARPGQTCVNNGICRGCGSFEECGLPQALSAKQTR